MFELKHGHGLRQIRVRGGSRVLFAATCKVIACNVKRWFRGLSSLRASSALLLASVGHILHRIAPRARLTEFGLPQRDPGLFMSHVWRDARCAGAAS